MSDLVSACHAANAEQCKAKQGTCRGDFTGDFIPGLRRLFAGMTEFLAVSNHV